MRLLDEDGCCRRLQRVERRHQVDEPFSTICSSAENQGSKETTWYVFPRSAHTLRGLVK